MALPAFVTGHTGGANQSTAQPSISASFPGPGNFAGNAIVVIGEVVAASGNPVIPKISDTAGNTYQSIPVSSGYSANGATIYCAWVAFNIAQANTNTLTITFGQSASFSSIAFAEYSDATSVAVVDYGGLGSLSSMAIGSGTALASPSMTPVGANELLITAGWINAGTVITAGGSWTKRVTSGFQDGIADQLSTGASPIAGAWTGTSGNWACCVFALCGQGVVTPPVKGNPTGTIMPAAQQNDTSGNRIWTVAGSIMTDPVSGKFYWYGTNEDGPGVYVNGFNGFNCYSSIDFLNWKFESVVWKPAGNTHYERPSVLYNAATGLYVMWMHQSFAALYVVATSPSPTGPFTQATSYATLDTFGTNGDFKLFLDNDGVSAYILRSGGTSNGTIGVSKLSANYQNTDGVNKAYFTNNASSPFGQQSEGHAMINVNGVYFWMTSAFTVWQPNLNKYVTSTSPLGPWSPSANAFQATTDPNALGLAGTQYSATQGNVQNIAFDSQTDQLIFIPGKVPKVVYLGDRYDNNLPNPTGTSTSAGSNFQSWRPILLPVTFPAPTTMSITWQSQWSFATDYAGAGWLNNAISGPSNGVMTTDALNKQYQIVK